jgi:TRAP-type C4-dicarboxylate transport system substrate-binding protein
MKARILILMALGLCASIHAETLSTTDGTRYDNITFKRVDPDGLYVEYVLPGNGLGMTKVKFSRLSDDQRKEFGYDATKAKDFEAQTAKANEDWRANALRMESEARVTRAQQDAQAAQELSAQTQRLLAMAQLKQAEADLARAAGGAGYGGGYDGGWGGFGIPIVSDRVPRAKRTLAPIVQPVPFPRINTPLSGRSR